jgi:hypothetical protein
VNNLMVGCMQGVNTKIFIHGFGKYSHFFGLLLIYRFSRNHFVFNLIRDLLLLFKGYNKKIKFF